MEEYLEITLLISETATAGILAQIFATYLQLPSIVLLLIFGIVLGPDGLGLLQPDLLGSGLEVIVLLSVALILFEGGLNLSLPELVEMSGSLRNLITVGILITCAGGGIAAHFLCHLTWKMAFLYASLVVVTGPTVVNPLLKNIGIEKHIATILSAESVFIDPIGAILSVLVLHVVVSQDVEPLVIIQGLLLRLAIGGAIGSLGGWLLSLALKEADNLSKELKTLVVLASIWMLFSFAQILDSESGLLSVVIAGIFLRNSALPDEKLLRQFNEQLSILSNSVLFILLAANLSITNVFALGWGGVLTVLVLMLVVRPIDIFISTWNQGLNLREQIFMSWVAPRGIVAASMASLFAISLTKQGIEGGDTIKALVFLSVMLTVFVQGLTARAFASKLNLTSSSEEELKEVEEVLQF